MRMVIGITVDLRNYEAYFKKFDKKYKCRALEFHILERDLDKGFHTKIKKVKAFLQEKRIKYVSFHSPDRILQSVLYKEKSEHLEDDRKKLMLMMESLKKLADELKQEIILVVHQGIKLPAELIDSMTDEELDGLRNLLLKKAKEGYDWMMSYTSGSKLLPMLENSPPSCTADQKVHLIDLAFEDIEERIGRNGFVLDISHAAMCVEYYKQNKVKFAALESIRREHHGVPYSLSSLENYIKKSERNISWIHVSNINGIMGENEGLAIGIKDGLIDFKKLVSMIEAKVKNPVGVLEIVNSHKEYHLVDDSMKKLKEILIR